MEEPELRRAIEKAELACYTDPQKVELFKLKEELYYAIDEKSHDADLTEMGAILIPMIQMHSCFQI